MKNILNKILLAIFLMIGINTFSQVNVSISNMTYISGTTISDCGNIDFGTNSTVRVQFAINLSKQSAQVVGVSNLYVYTIGTSGLRIERKNETVQPVSFDTNYLSSADITMSESDFSTSGGTLFAIFKTSSGVEYQTTCNYTITKTQQPVFTLSPTSATVGCGSTSQYTFSVTNVYSSPGTLTYSWNTPGWTGTVNPSLSSVTLTPSSLTSLPSNVTVTPYLNGVAQPTRTCTVTRAPFSSSATISGNSAVCSSSTYTINGLLAGQSVTAWSLSNPSIATLSTTSGNSTNVTKTGDGSVTLTATITNSCNQTTNKSMSLLLGTTNPPAPISGPASVNTGALVTYSVPSVPGATSYLWYLPYPYDTVTNFNYSGQRWQKRTNSSSSNTIQVFTGLGGISGLIQVMAVNGCGTSGARTLSVTHGGGGGGTPRISNPDKSTDIKIYPNPATNVINLELDQNIKPDSDIKAILYDTQGAELQRVEIINSTAKINVEDLPVGIYIISLNIDGKIESHKIYVE